MIFNLGVLTLDKIAVYTMQIDQHELAFKLIHKLSQLANNWSLDVFMRVKNSLANLVQGDTENN